MYVHGSWSSHHYHGFISSSKCSHASRCWFSGESFLFRPSPIDLAGSITDSSLTARKSSTLGPRDRREGRGRECGSPWKSKRSKRRLLARIAITAARSPFLPVRGLLTVTAAPSYGPLFAIRKTHTPTRTHRSTPPYCANPSPFPNSIPCPCPRLIFSNSSNDVILSMRNGFANSKSMGLGPAA